MVAIPLFEHELVDAILRLKKERNAVILAHYYQDSEIQDIADFLGDSLQLALAAQKTNADVIVFCAVHFMAETAKILNPERIVLIPDLKAGCSLADTCPPDLFKRFLDRYPGHTVISYINCSAEIKALSDVICTSSNAETIIRSIPDDKPIIFAPDKHLGRFLSKKTGRDMVLWNGACMVHEIFSEKAIFLLKAQHPDALLLAHPECEERVLRHADHIGSTASILNFAVNNPAQRFIVATEAGIIHQMQRRAPHKTFIPLGTQDGCSCNMCPHMRLNTLQKIYLALKNLEPQIHMDEGLRQRALAPLSRMLEISAQAAVV